MRSDKPPTLVEEQASFEAADALKALLGRIGDIFGVFDFSFFVAGAVCFAALVFGVHVFGEVEWPTSGDWSAAHICAAIVTCYVLGIVCFAAGTLRRRFRRPFDALPVHLHDFGLESAYARFLSPGGRQAYERLYTRLWVEVRQSRQLAPSFNLLTRYWVMAAMCDGLGAAWIVWAAVWGSWIATRRPELPAVPIRVLVELALLGAAALCWREAHRYSKYQLYELVATLAYARVPVSSPAASPSTHLEPLPAPPPDGQ